MNAPENNKPTKEYRYLFSVFFPRGDGSRHYSVDFFFSCLRVVIKDKYNIKRST